MPRYRGKTVIAVIAATAVLSVALSPPGVASTTRTNVIIDWNDYTSRALSAAGRSTGIASPIYAIVHGAVYDAVNSITRTHQPYLAATPAKRWYSQEAAAASAAYRTLTGLLPEQQPMLAPLYEQSLATIPDGTAKAGGISVGTQAAQALLAERADDGRDGPSIVEIGAEPGEWRPTPPDFTTDPASWLANVTPFVIPSAEADRSAGPPPLTSAAYARDFVEVKTYGARSGSPRTEEQTDVALFWDQSPWFEIVVSLANAEHLSVADSARLFAMTSMAGADGAIDCHSDKYFYDWWRPITAIHEAGSDGNPATRPDRSWEPLIDTPPTPEHPSGHTCVSGAVTGALRAFFGTDRMSYSATSASSGTTRSFTSFSQALAETVDARVWSGIHFRTADMQGAQLGQDVARHLRTHYFKPALH